MCVGGCGFIHVCVFVCGDVGLFVCVCVGMWVYSCVCLCVGCEFIHVCVFVCGDVGLFMCVCTLCVLCVQYTGTLHVHVQYMIGSTRLCNCPQLCNWIYSDVG